MTSREISLARQQTGEPLFLRSPVRPWFAVKDLMWLAYLYPLRWLARVCSDRFWFGLQRLADPLYRWIHREPIRAAARRMAAGVPASPEAAAALAKLYIRNALQRGFDDLAFGCGRPDAGSHPPLITGLEHLERAAQLGRGVVTFSVHSFATRSAHRALRSMGYPVVVVRARTIPVSFGRFGQWALGGAYTRCLQNLAVESISNDDPNVTLEIARRLRAGWLVHIAPDSRVSATSHLVPFLGTERRISSGILDIARICRCPLLPLSAAYDGPRLRIGLLPPLELHPAPGAEAHTRANLPLLSAELERQIRANPAQWEMWVDL